MVLNRSNPPTGSELTRLHLESLREHYDRAPTTPAWAASGYRDWRYSPCSS